MIEYAIIIAVLCIFFKSFRPVFWTERHLPVGEREKRKEEKK